MTTEIDIGKHEKAAVEQIKEYKSHLGRSLVILGHQYQRRQIVGLSDFVGDSYALSAKAAASEEAKHIVFCGVEFMAESAEILSAAGQSVYHPNSQAGCPMADMARLDEVETAFERISSRSQGKVIPLVYMNSSAAVKAFCGRNDGLVCTSSNAGAAMKWAYERGRVVLFMPDEHLATNTADALAIPEEARTLYDPSHPDGGEGFHVDPATRLVQWKGYCHVHTFFTPEQVAKARERDECLVVVHPECPREVTALADEVGSTTRIVKYVENAPAGSTVVVGTEINLVERLAREQAGRKRILPLGRSFCPNMFKINLSNLLQTLESLGRETYRLSVPDDVARDARLALQRMLEVA